MKTYVLAGIIFFVAALFLFHYIFSPLSQPNPVLPIIAPVVQQHHKSSEQVVWGDRTKKQIIFTFDAGSTSESADAILAVLAKHSVKGTFFMTGKFVEANPELVKKILAGGNEIFNHTYDHKDLTKLTDQDIKTELDGMENTFSKLTGSSTKPYFRAPYGALNKRVLSAASNDGYTSVYWTKDALDWKAGETSASVEKRIMANVLPGTIFLMHVGDGISGNILDDMFTQIEAKGYKIVSLTQGI